MKHLYLIRHAIAEDRALFSATGKSDHLRPLTEKGQRKMKAIAKKLSLKAPDISLLCQSPLLRSQQTATILKEVLPNATVTTINELNPSTSLKQLIQALSSQRQNSIALIGHEEQLSELTHLLLTGNEGHPPLLRYKKGGIACLEYEKQIEPETMKLKWFLTPKILLD